MDPIVKKKTMKPDPKPMDGLNLSINRLIDGWMNVVLILSLA